MIFRYLILSEPVCPICLSVNCPILCYRVCLSALPLFFIRFGFVCLLPVFCLVSILRKVPSFPSFDGFRHMFMPGFLLEISAVSPLLVFKVVF